MLIYLIAELQEIQRNPAQFLKERFQKIMSIDWFGFHMDEHSRGNDWLHYPDCMWTRTRKVQRVLDSRKTMKDLNEILEVDGAGEKPLNFFVEGKK